jgi:hypothetical protein
MQWEQGRDRAASLALESAAATGSRNSRCDPHCDRCHVPSAVAGVFQIASSRTLDRSLRVDRDASVDFAILDLRIDGRGECMDTANSIVMMSAQEDSQAISVVE